MPSRRSATERQRAESGKRAAVVRRASAVLPAAARAAKLALAPCAPPPRKRVAALGCFAQSFVRAPPAILKPFIDQHRIMASAIAKSDVRSQARYASRGAPGAACDRR